MLGPIISENDPNFSLHGSLRPTKLEKNLKPCDSMSSYISGYNHPSLLAAVNKPENIVSRDEMSFMHLQHRITLFILMDYSIHIVNMELSVFTK